MSSQRVTKAQELTRDSAQISQDKNNNYSFYIITDGLSTEEIEQKLRSVASRLAQEKGCSSYVIVSEEKVHVIAGKTDWPNGYEFPQNLYEEVIIQRNLDNYRMRENTPADYDLRNANLYKIKLIKD
ncbi:MAG: hypothetical protein HW387_491 [Parachlamydiales bacterium]|nr:hypothetical protein [Parachlamydiales bacterium]